MENPLNTDYEVISWEHIDDSRCFSSLESTTMFDEPGMGCPSVNEIKTHLEKIFKDEGWEGDGEIECFYVPPCFTNRGDTYCEAIFHVKQSNNGTSWLAIPKYLEWNMPRRNSDDEAVLSLY